MGSISRRFSTLSEDLGGVVSWNAPGSDYDRVARIVRFRVELLRDWVPTFSAQRWGQDCHFSLLERFLLREEHD